MVGIKNGIVVTKLQYKSVLKTDNGENGAKIASGLNEKKTAKTFFQLKHNCSDIHCMVRYGTSGTTIITLLLATHKL